jgi:SAM-dependent methyltransferase
VLRTTGTKINLACGSVFVSDEDWVNLDYSPSSLAVQRANLLSRLPLPDDGAMLVYSSHFVEHIPRDQVLSFLVECRRVLAPGGVVRLVLPDLGNLCRAYLGYRDQGEHAKADFVVLEMIDQCVRSESGGWLGRFYRTLQSSSESESVMIEFVRERTGEQVLDVSSTNSARNQLGWQTMTLLSRWVRGKAERAWVRFVLFFLPKAFRTQNVSLAVVGERHHWLWDFGQLRAELQHAGFEAVERCSASVSGFDGFPFHPLDLDTKGGARKGAESMYIEARKPVESVD